MMRFPAGWAAAGLLIAGTAGAAEAIDYRTYTSGRLGLSLSIPAEWEVSETKDGALSVTGSTGVLVVSARPRGGATDATLREHGLAFVRLANVRIRNSGRKTINGIPGWLFQYTTRDAEDPLLGDTLCLLHEEWLVAVAFATREWLYAATRPVFETTIRSLRLRTPDGLRPLARGFRRFEDPRGAYRLQVPEDWRLTSSSNSFPFFAGSDGTLQVIVDGGVAGGARYLPGDAEILARAYLERASYRLQRLVPGQLDSLPAQLAYGTPKDASDWQGCFVVTVRDGKLYVLKIAYHGAAGEARVQDLMSSFQFTPRHAANSKTRDGAKSHEEG